MNRTLACVLGLILVANSSAAEKPNIILILSDDLGWGDLGCYGQQKILTPNLDRLAAEGMRFTNAYAGNSVCAPSRSCLMQGLHPGHARVRGNSFQSYRHSLQPKDQTVATVLQKAGYKTGLFGKWGLGLSSQPGIPNNMGFDEFFGYLNQRKAHSYYPEFLWDNTKRVLFPQHAGHEHHRQSEYDDAGRVKPFGIQDPSRAHYSFDVIHRKSLDFVRRHYQRPFFLYLAHTIPHGPVIVPELGPYKDKDWPIGHKEWAGMVTRLDSAVGELLRLLKELEIDRRTIVFFASDNGHSSHGYDRDKTVMSIGQQFQSHGPTRGRKGDSYDGAFRVPAMARWPGKIKAGQVSDQIWAFWDFLPTAASLAGAEAPKQIDGISIVPTLLGDANEQEQHDYLYWEFNQKQAVRTGRWFAHRRSNGPVELYDLSKDPQQKQDLAGQHPELANKVLRWMTQAHTPSEVWPSPHESKADFQRRLKQSGVPARPKNVDG
ncbi:MAG: arylsulfatase [Planctomycetes bacterium]|nr:arylsulfatase [Planctomycetota bacterium]